MEEPEKRLGGSGDPETAFVASLLVLPWAMWKSLLGSTFKEVRVQNQKLKQVPRAPWAPLPPWCPLGPPFLAVVLCTYKFAVPIWEPYGNPYWNHMFSYYGFTLQVTPYRNKGDSRRVAVSRPKENVVFRCSVLVAPPLFIAAR